MKLSPGEQARLLLLLLMGMCFAWLDRPQVTVSYLIGTAAGYALFHWFIGLLVALVLRLMRKARPECSLLRQGIRYGVYAGGVFLAGVLIDTFLV